jgi:hypothetical protein
MKQMNSKIRVISFGTEIKTKSNGKPYQTGLGYCEELKCEIPIIRTLINQEGVVKADMNDAHVGRTFDCLITEGSDNSLFAEISLKRTIDTAALAIFAAKAKEVVRTGSIM